MSQEFPGAGADTFSTYEARVTDTPIPIPQFVELYFDYDRSDYGYWSLSWDGLWSDVTNVSDRGPVTSLGLVPPTREHSGRIQHSFVLDFYNRIHIAPNPLDFGALLEETTLNLEIWNAFFEPSTYIDQIIVNAPGITLNPDDITPPDVVIADLDNYIVEVTAITEGPAILDAQVDFQFVNTTYLKPSPLVSIIGRRGKLFPFFTSWEDDPIERLEWKTNILETDGWGERRYRLRQWPRLYIQLGMGAVGDMAADLRVALLSAQDSDYGLPLWMYEEKLKEDVTIGDEIIYVNTVDGSFQAGSSAIIIESERRFETVDVSEVHPDHLVLEQFQGASQDWAKGTLIYPVRVCRIDNVISLSAKVGNTVKAVLNLESKERETVFETQSFPSYLSKPRINYIPNWRSGRNSSYQRKVDTVDTGIYPKQYFNLSPRYGETQEFEWFLNGRAMVTEFKGLMQYLAGRHGEVWVPSWKDDMPLLEPYVSGQAALNVRGNFASKFLQANISEPVHIRVRLKDGSEYCAQMISATPNPASPTDDIISLVLGWSVDFGVNWVEDLSIMTLVRLDTDSVSIVWKTPQMAIAKTSFTYCPDQPEQVI